MDIITKYNSVIAFINPGSGGLYGKKVYTKLQCILGIDHVFNLDYGSPREGLMRHRNKRNLRIMACGGDGTVGWILSVMDTIQFKFEPSVLPIPLGTGNDMSRVLQWGANYAGEPLIPLLDDIVLAVPIKFDRWDIQSLELSSEEVEKLGTELLKTKEVPALSLKAFSVANELDSEQGEFVFIQDETLPQYPSVDETYFNYLEGRDAFGIGGDGLEEFNIKQRQQENGRLDDSTRRCHFDLEYLDDSTTSDTEVLDLQHDRNDDDQVINMDDVCLERQGDRISLINGHGDARTLKTGLSKSLSHIEDVLEGGCDKNPDETCHDNHFSKIGPRLKNHHWVGSDDVGGSEASRNLVDQDENSSQYETLSNKMVQSSSVLPEYNVESCLDREVKTAMIKSKLTRRSNCLDMKYFGEIPGVGGRAKPNKLKKSDQCSDVGLRLSKASQKKPTYVSPPPEAKNLVMNNYFSFGIDSRIALEFHMARKANPHLFPHQIINKAWYGLFGIKSAIKSSLSKPLCKLLKLELDGNPVKLPKHLQAIVFLQIPSYSSGTHLWGDYSNTRNQRCPPRVCDFIFEVVGLRGVLHLSKLQTGFSAGTRIGQARSAVITNLVTLPVQSDGEPWLLPPCRTEITHRNQSLLLLNVSRGQKAKRYPLLTGRDLLFEEVITIPPPVKNTKNSNITNSDRKIKSNGIQSPSTNSDEHTEEKGAAVPITSKSRRHRNHSHPSNANQVESENIYLSTPVLPLHQENFGKNNASCSGSINNDISQEDSNTLVLVPPLSQITLVDRKMGQSSPDIPSLE